MAKQQKKRRKKKRKGKGKGPGHPQGGGIMQSMMSGFRSAVGVNDKPKKKTSLLENIIWGVLILAALAFLVHRYTN